MEDELDTIFQLKRKKRKKMMMILLGVVVVEWHEWVWLTYALNQGTVSSKVIK